MIGAVVLATDQGLGYLAKDFYDNGVIDVVYIQPHTTRDTHYEWFPNRVASPYDLLGCDAIIFFETAFDWKLIDEARKVGTTTALMPMFECTPNPLPYQPDIILNPSDLDQQLFPTGTRINVPVNRPWKLRKKAEVFVHNAGNGGLFGRNGTAELLEAMKHVKSPIKLIIRSQKHEYQSDDPRIEFVHGTVPADGLYDGDVFIFPEKFNGLSLPLQEAFASGMAVMAGNRFPMNTWLPKELLIPVAGYKKHTHAVEFDVAQYEPRAIAAKIDEWYGKDVSAYSLMGKQFAKENRWGRLRPLYKKLLCSTSTKTANL